MQADPSAIALAVAGALFVLYLLLKLRISFVPASPEARAAKQKMLDAKARARAPGKTAAQRADAWREAALIALEDLKRPSLAASFARRAERADPQDEGAVRVLAISMRRAGRLRALERLLWRRLANEPTGAVHQRAFDELVALYEGPMRKPDRAVVLKRLRAAVRA